MLPGSWKDAVIAAGSSKSAEVDLGRQYENLMVVIPTIDTAQVSFEVAEKSAGTFQALHDTDRADGSSHEIKSVSGSGAITWIVPIGGFQYIKVKTSAAQTSGAVTCRVMGVRS